MRYREFRPKHPTENDRLQENDAATLAQRATKKRSVAQKKLADAQRKKSDAAQKYQDSLRRANDQQQSASATLRDS